jgi:hypothetical protein
MQTTSTRPNDPIAMLVVYGLLALMLYAGVKAFDRAPDPVQAQGPIIFATPALPTAIPDAPAFVLAAPTPTPAPIEAAPVYSDVSADTAPQIGAGDVDYLDTVGAQAPHAIRDSESDQPTIAPDALNDPNLNGGNVAPEGCPFPIVNGVCANGVLAKSIDDSAIGSKSTAQSGPEPAHAEPIAVAVPPISAEQAAVLSQRTSNTCPDGQVFYPRTGCHTPGSGGPQPGAVGERRP